MVETAPWACTVPNDRRRRSTSSVKVDRKTQGAFVAVVLIQEKRFWAERVAGSNPARHAGMTEKSCKSRRHHGG